jgi:RNA-binding protein Musashi
MYFDQFGTITDVVVMYDHNTQRPRGFGFITYDSEEAVDKVLVKSFHELNGKMVEVKRAVPKELSPGSSRSPLGGYNYGLSRVSFPNGYTPSTVGGYGLRMDDRLSPISGGRSGYPPFGSGYGVGMNFEPGLNPGYGGSANFNSNLSYGRGLNPYYVSNSNRFGNPIGYDGRSGGSSFFSSVTRNLWGSGGLNYGTNSASSSAYQGSGSGSIVGSTFGNTGVNWGSSGISAQGGNNVSNSSGNLGYGGGDNSYSLGMGGYGRNSGTNAAPTSSFAASNGGFDGGFDFHSGGSVNGGDSTWRSSNAEQDGSGPFGYGPFGYDGLGSAASDVSAKAPPGYVGGYSVYKRQSNRGKRHSLHIFKQAD